ncbi:MAG: hypothetical protein Q8Q09_24445 [Deltaproteobacteria bacterium]|nr:hypothetical protein [Deltaproteobacteria bacterium]
MDEAPVARAGGKPILLVALLVATCGLVYELLAGTVASWVLGDTVTQFSLVIGLYLGAMGLGSWLSSKVSRGAAERFIETELALAVLGGAMVPLLFLLFDRPLGFRAALYLSVLALGALVGLEIPLLLRVLGEHESFRSVIARVLAFDHLGSLVGSLAFAWWLAPNLGVLRAGLLVGATNAIAAFASTYALVLAPSPRRIIYRTMSVIIALGWLVSMAYAQVLERTIDRETHTSYAESSRG